MWKRLILSLAFLAACGPETAADRPWLAWQPIRLDVASNVPSTYAKPDMVRVTAKRLAQLGLGYSASGARAIQVEMSACNCTGCSGFTSYVSSTDNSRIVLCPVLATMCAWASYPKCIEMTIGHELCHVLGIVGHPGLGKGDLCSATTAEHDNVDAYTANDIEKICASGGVVSGVCNGF